MAKLKRFVLIPLLGSALALSLAAVAACGGGKKATLTLDAGEGGSLSKTEYSVKAGADLSDFLEGKQPSATVKGLTFAGWYNGADLIEEGDTMPEGGLTLTAKYLAPYTLNVYRLGDDTPEASTGTAIWHEAFDVLGAYEMPRGYEADDTKTNKTATDSLEVDDAFELHLRGIEVWVTFRANGPDRVDIEGKMPSEKLDFGADYTVPACAFTAPENYRFAGWTKSGDKERYLAGDTIEDVSESFSLYANWDRGYADLAGGDDLIFFPSEKENVALLVREGLGEKEGKYDPATRVFTFTLDSGEKLIGRVTDWNRYTFTYEQTGEEVSYTFRDAFTEEDDANITLTLDLFDGATFTDKAGKLFGISGSLTGVWSLYGTLDGEAIYAFLSERAAFFFKLGGSEDIFYIQGFEAGSYSLITEEGDLDDYYVLELDGFGKAYYEVYNEAWTVTEGTYTVLENGECEIDLGDDSFRCMLAQLDATTYGYLLADPELEATFTSKDGKTTIGVDAYGDLGYATVTEEGGKSTLYGKYWDVFSLTVDGTTTLYRYLRCFDDLTGEVVRTFYFEDDGSFEEVGLEAGQYFLFDLPTSSIGLFFLTLDGKATKETKSLGSWTLYSFVAEGDDTIATRLAGGTYQEDGSSLRLTLVGAAAEGAPAPFKTSPVTVLLSGVASSTMTLDVFIVDNAANEMTMYADDGSNAKIEIDGYGRTTYTDASGVTHQGTFSSADYDEDPPFEESDASKDCVLGITDTRTGELFYVYLPYGLGNDNRFYPMGSEFGTYEGGATELYGTYLRLSGFAGEEGGLALYGSLSTAVTGYVYVVQGVYTFEREEYFGTIWHFEGKYWIQNTVIPDGMMPTDIDFYFVLDTIADYPVFRVYNEEDEVEYEGPNGEKLSVTGVRTARFTDAEGHVWTGEASRGQDLDWDDGHVIADTVIFEYLGIDGNYYDFTFRVFDATGTFLIRDAVLGSYYQIDASVREVNSALRINLDGYGGAVLYVPNVMAPDQPEAGTILATGSYEEAGGGLYRFVPAEKFAEDYPAFTFELGTFTESVSHGSTQYPVYFLHEVEREGKFVNADWSVLSINGYDRAVYIDGRGRRIEGTFAVLGQHVVRLTADGADLFFATDKAKGTFSLYEDDLIIENGVVLAYTGTSRDVVISDPTVTKIGRGAFLDAQIASIDLGSVVEIGVRAFDGATLSVVKGGAQVEKIDDQAFLYCDNLTSVNFPKATYVGRQAFAHCYLLESVTLGGEVTFLGDRAFESCFVDPLELTPLGTFKLVLGNKTTAPDLGGASVFAIYYGGGAYSRDISFTVRVTSLDALKVFFLDTKWQQGSKSVGQAGTTFEHSVCFTQPGSEAGAWYATDNLDRVFFNGVITVNGQYFGAYELKDGTLSIYSYTDPAEGHAGNFTTSTATLSDDTLSGAFGRESAHAFKHQGTVLTYQGDSGNLVITLRENFPLLGEYGGNKARVTAENGKAVFTLGGYRHEATLSEGLTFTVVTSRAAFDEFIEGEGGSLRITMDEEGNVTMRSGTLLVDGQTVTFNRTTDCGQVMADGEPVENAYYLDLLIGDTNYRITLRLSITLDEETLDDLYSFTSTVEQYLTLKTVQDTADQSRSVLFGYDKEGALQSIWLRYTVENFAGLKNIYNVKGTWEEAEGGYHFYAIDGYDPVEGITFEIKVTKSGDDITSVTVSEYRAEINFTGTADDESTVHIVSGKDETGAPYITVEGTFKSVAGKEFTARTTGMAEYISGNTFAVYTTKELDETQYYRILITIQPLENTFSYKAERSGDVVGTPVTSEGETYTVWVYSPQKGAFNTTTWFFMQLETTVNGETVLLDGTAVYKNQYPYNVEFVVTTEGSFVDRIYRVRIGVGLDVSSFIAL